MSLQDLKLSATLRGHQLDVRSICVTPDDQIISGSRDKTAKLWVRNETGYNCVKTYRGHTNFVSSVCFLPPTEKFSSGVVLTGSNDYKIRAFFPDDESPFFVFTEHTNTVCHLSVGLNPNTFLSSSWDISTKLWSVDSVVSLVTYKGHTAAVWASIQLANGMVVTGSADKSVIMWSADGARLKTLLEHRDCVRGLSTFGSDFFLSVGNDACIKLWSDNGKCIETCYGHSAFIYSVSDVKNTSGCFVTGGEDQTIRYWSNCQNTYTMVLPAQSVWCVASLSNGDVVCGSSDSIIRIFTLHSDRVASAEFIEEFEQAKNILLAASDKMIGGVKVSDLPGIEALKDPGTKDGQTRLVRDEGTVIAYNWSMASKNWEKIGDVMGAVGGTQETSGKILYEGKEYDFVFDVDIEDGKPPIKLPYDVTEDPWFAAQKFIHTNNLPQVYLEQVANFIVTNSKSKARTNDVPTAPTEYRDPFTGGSSYIPASNVAMDTSGAALDPFTGANSYRANTAPPVEIKPVLSKSYFPQKTYLRFDQGNVTAISEKMKEFNNKIDKSSQKLDNQTLDLCSKLLSGQLSDESVLDALVKVLNWPQDLIFPALDMIRLAVKYENICQSLCDRHAETIMNHLETLTSQEYSVVVNKMLAFRILSNLFNHEIGEKLALANKYTLLYNASASSTPSLNKNAQVAITTLILNLTIAFVKRNDSNGIEHLLEDVPKLIASITDLEAVFRLLVAIGTLLVDAEDEIKTQVKQKLTSDAAVKDKVLSYCIFSETATSGEPATVKVMGCALQLYECLS